MESRFAVGDSVLYQSEPMGISRIGRVMAINVTEVPMSTQPPQTYKFDTPRYAILIEATGSFVYPRMDDQLITKAAWS